MTYLRATSLVSACAVAALLTGCGSSNTASGRDSEVRNNLTPELHTLAGRPIDDDNMFVLTCDENLRMANQDLGRLLLFDRPSRLTRERIPH